MKFMLSFAGSCCIPLNCVGFFCSVQLSYMESFDFAKHAFKLNQGVQKYF